MINSAVKPSVRDVLQRYAIAPKKRWGQNFLHDDRICERIVSAAAPTARDRVLEIGPGLGALTRPLLESGAHVTAIEVDPRVCDYLQDELGSHDRFRLMRRDVRDVSIEEELETPVIALTNVPYSITGPILGWLIEHCECFTRAVIMVQREVGDRIVAGSGGREIGAPSVLLRLAYRVEKLFDVGTGAFLPRPEVVSVVLRLDRRTDHERDVELEGWVHRAYRERRKMLRKTLGEVLGDESVVEEALIALSQPPTARPEDLEPDEWTTLARFVREARS